MGREASRRPEGLLTALRRMSSLSQATSSGISLPLATAHKGASELKSCGSGQVTCLFQFQLFHL